MCLHDPVSCTGVFDVGRRRLRGCELETDHVTSCDTPTVLLCELLIFHIHVCLEKSFCSLEDTVLR